MVNGVLRFVYGIGIFLIVAGALAFLMLLWLRGKAAYRNRVISQFYIFLFFFIIGCIVLTLGAFMKYHEEPEFCGTTCHAMEPYYDSYLDPGNNTVMRTHVENNVTCLDCHTGPGFKGQIDPFLKAPNEIYAEATNNYHPETLHGFVPSRNCLKGCHDDLDWVIEAPQERGADFTVVDGKTVWPTRYIYHPYTENGTDFTELEARETCVDCHDQRLNGVGYTRDACPICHDLTIEELDQHRNQTCAMGECHQEPEFVGHREVMDNCMFCHDRRHPEDARVPYPMGIEHGIFDANNTFCTTCHSEEIEIIEASKSEHASAIGCPTCHKDHKYHPDCLECHSETNVDHPISGYDDCKSCHVLGGHDPLKIDFSGYDSERLSKTFCNNNVCHETDVYQYVDTQLGGKLHTQDSFKEDCLLCHEEHDADVDCLNCHKGSTAPTHSTASPYDVCGECHSNGHDIANITFTDFSAESQILDSFCEGCHKTPANEMAASNTNHTALFCADCHEEHDRDVNCSSCHSTEGIANPPSHYTAGNYADCLSCHETGHNPKFTTFVNAAGVENDFCQSCHATDRSNQSVIFEEYGGKHQKFVGKCTMSCHNEHSKDISCTSPLCHVGSLFPADHTGFDEPSCLECHNSAHNPYNAAPKSAQELSQQEYMAEYYTLNMYSMENSFAWNKRGSHILDRRPCSECHISPTEHKFPVAISQLNATGQDCASNCHDWTQVQVTGTPYSLISATTTKHSNIFNDPLNGGCAGTCHQTDPSNPIYDGRGHGTINNCLDSNCHLSGFSYYGVYHLEHQAGLEKAGMDCYTVCHEQGDKYGVPIDGGCYYCHKSGHDPQLLDTSPCSGECHT